MPRPEPQPGMPQRRSREVTYPRAVSPEVAKATNGLKSQLDEGARRRLKL